MPSKSTVMVWAQVIPEFTAQYTKARMWSAESDADDVAHYARQAAKGEIKPDAATAAINGLKWSAAHRNAKKYGDRTVVAGDPDAPIPVVDLSSLTPEQLRALAHVKLPADS